MVKIFLNKRYTKNSCTDVVTDNILKWFGGFQIFGRAKVIHSLAVWQNPKDDKLYSININKHSPKSYHDFWTLNFLRTYSDCIVTTGKILRNEPQAFNPHVVRELKFPLNVYYGGRNKNTNDYIGKPVAILTNSLKQNFHQDTLNPIYSEKLYKKHIITRTKTLERFKEYQTDKLDYG